MHILKKRSAGGKRTERIKHPFIIILNCLYKTNTYIQKYKINPVKYKCKHAIS